MDATALRNSWKAQIDVCRCITCTWSHVVSLFHPVSSQHRWLWQEEYCACNHLFWSQRDSSLWGTLGLMFNLCVKSSFDWLYQHNRFIPNCSISMNDLYLVLVEQWPAFVSACSPMRITYKLERLARTWEHSNKRDRAAIDSSSAAAEGTGCWGSRTDSQTVQRNGRRRNIISLSFFIWRVAGSHRTLQDILEIWIYVFNILVWLFE